MIKNNKGFTLTELLAIIVLISIFGIIAGPNLTKKIQSSEQEEKNTLSQNIENAAMIYAAKYYSEKIVNCTENCEINFTLNDLEQDGLIDLKGKCSSAMDKKIYIVREGSGIEYNYNDIEIADCYSSNIGS